jgi:hypothetical protein
VKSDLFKLLSQISITMRLSIILLPLPLLTMSFNPADSGGDYAPHFTFNKDIEEEGKSCTAEEWNLVRNTLDNAVPGHRRVGTRARSLRENSSSSSYYYGSGCYSTSKLQTRETDVQNHSTATNRRSLWAFSQPKVDQCAVDVKSARANLDVLLPRLSSTCQALIKSPLDVACVERVECEISHFSLRSAETDRLIVAKVPARGGSFCANSPVTLEAITKFDLGKVQFSWKDAQGQENTRIENAAPYLMMGRTGTNVHGAKFPVGEYTLTATSESDPTKTQTISFKTVGC